MFANLFYLIIVLLLISIGTENQQHLIDSPIVAVLLGFLVYFGTLGIISIEGPIFKKNIYKRKSLYNALVNLQLILFLTIFLFVLGAHRIFVSQTLMAVVILVMYFFGIWFFHYRSYKETRVSFFSPVKSPSGYALTELRMLIPYIIPFLIFSFIIDLIQTFPDDAYDNALFNYGNGLTGVLIFSGGTALFLMMMMVILPPIIMHAWQCEPLENEKLVLRLDQLCQKAKFKHAGIKTWTIMNDTLTAAIIGLFPRFRYVIFTKRLLHDLSDEEIEAVLAHEIGHSYRKHLFLYPFIILGMVLGISLLTNLFSETINEALLLANRIYPSDLWVVVYSFVYFILFIGFIWLYLRFFYGYVSRLFERQADLHVFEVEIPPKYLIESLNTVGVVTGNTHDIPSWHHYSIRERMNFINDAILDPSIVINHHRWVRNNMIVYFIMLFLLVGIIISPMFPETTPFKQVSNLQSELSESISDRFNLPLRQKLAKQYVNQYHFKGDSKKVEEIIEESFRPYASVKIPGVAEFLAANSFYDEGMYMDSAKMMTLSWSTFDKEYSNKDVIDEFENLTDKIMVKIPNTPEATRLIQAYQEFQNE